MLDFPEVAQLALHHAQSLCSELFPLGKRKGTEFTVGDIYGNAGKSLSISLSSGVWSDFSGDIKGGQDLTALVAAAKSMSMGDAANWIVERYGNAPVVPSKVKKEDFVPIWPSPVEPQSFNHPILGKPSCVYPYNNHEGILINYVCRFETKDDKEFRPLSFGTYKGKTGWHWRQLPAPRPLYGLDILQPSGAVIICEGEKAWQALYDKMPDQSIITWPGGSNAIAECDWTALMSKKYDVLLWPDNDAAGQKAMQHIAMILKDHVVSIGILDVSSLAESEDAADFTGNIEEFIRLNRKAVNFNTVEPEVKETNGEFNPLALPGLIGDTVRSIIKYALQPQPELALFNTLAFAGSVFGRRYASPMNTRTNVYMIGIARTAGGKDHSRQYISGIAEKANLMHFMGAHYIRSDVGLLCDIMEKPSQVVMVDEIGMYLEAVSNARAPSHIRNVSAVLTKLYTSSGSFYDHGQTADRKLKPLVIQKPNLCLYGTTTEKNYVKALRAESIESGELNRFLVYKSSRKFNGSEQEPPKWAIEEDLIDQWKVFSEGFSGMISLGDFPPEPIIVTWDEECRELQRGYYRKQMEFINKDGQAALLWGRYMENIVKIAMIFAIARDRDSPAFTPQDFTVSAGIVDMCLDYMAHIATDQMAESDYESLHHELLMFFKKRPLGVNRTELSRHFRKLKPRDLSELVTSLKDQELIEQVQIPADLKGRPKTVYKLIAPNP